MKGNKDSFKDKKYISMLYKELKSKSEADVKKSGGQFISVGILRKLAHHLSESEFIKSIQNQELPALKLTDKEMEVLRGGFDWGGGLNWNYSATSWNYRKVAGEGVYEITPIFAAVALKELGFFASWSLAKPL